MNRDWLWDQKTSLKKAKQILKDPLNPNFLRMASMLLLRKNTPREVFNEYLSPLIFYQNWEKIKRVMKKDAWGTPRLHFWHAVYEKVREKFKRRKIVLRPTTLYLADEFCRLIGDKIKNLRRKRGLTQKELSNKLQISQQIISRIESGRQNISLLTLKNIVSSLGAEVKIELLLPPSGNSSSTSQSS